MSRHRGTGGIRGISKGPIIAVVTIMLLVLGTIGWFRLRDHIDDQGIQAAQACVEGNAVLEISADPTIAPTLTALAQQWTADTPRVIRDHCLTAQVTATPSAPAATLLAADAPWDRTLGPPPALWVPLDTRATARAAHAVAGQPKSLATSPLLLAVPPEVARALTTAGTDWTDLPKLQSRQDSLDELGLPGWGALRLALPTGPGTEATTAALEAVAAAVTGAGPHALTVEQADSQPAVAALTALALGADALGTGAGPTTTDALTAVATAPIATGTVHAVPIIEQFLYAAVKNHTIAGVTTYRPAGPAPVADYPAAIVDTPWVDETLARAAAEFVDYIRQPEQARTFVAAGFRVDGEPAPTGVSLPFEPLTTTLAAPDAATVDALLHTRLNPVPTRSTTLLIGTSTSGSSSSNTAVLTTVTTTLAAILDRSPDDTAIALRFAPNSSATSSTGSATALGDLTPEQRTALTEALTDATPGTTPITYDTIADTYRDATDGYAPDRPNSLLIITTGTDDDTSARTELLDLVAEEQGRDRNVHIDVLMLDSAATTTTPTTTATDNETLETLAADTGGTFTTVDPEDTTTLSDTLRKLMSTP
ncbi:MAG: substrate-binding domain-containing protein [Rhodococcus sp. (in: high G+C Gram-positive bacteria)]|uniref:substrate-binding domain-containing protein n=1 Tax=Rhodococcus sp. TaxID=1831 RepID=UPI003BB76C53